MNIKSLFIVASLASAGIVSGAQAADLKLGVINMNVLMHKSPQAMNATAEMSKKFGSRKNELVAEQDEIKNKQEQLNKNGATMTSQQVQDAQSQLDELQRDLNRKSGDYQDDINMEQNSLLSKLQEAVYKATQEFALTQKYDLVLAEGVMYAAPAVDITDQVLAQMQKDYKASGAAPSGG